MISYADSWYLWRHLANRMTRFAACDQMLQYPLHVWRHEHWDSIFIPFFPVLLFLLFSVFLSFLPCWWWVWNIHGHRNICFYKIDLEHHMYIRMIRISLFWWSLTFPFSNLFQISLRYSCTNENDENLAT